MLFIRLIVFATLLLMFAGQPSQPTQALSVNVHSPNTETQFSCANVSEVPESECKALVALYESTDGPNWDDATGWLESNTPCNWYGVICQSGQVTELRLSGEDGNSFGLQGDIPAEIGNLPRLITLQFSYNDVSNLPAEIGNLSALKSIYLDSNQLSKLPAEIGNLSNLNDLYLGFNQLSTIPAEIGNLSNLNVLSLWFNQLSTIPPEIGNLSSLTGLSLNSNQLSTIPAEIGNLSNLTQLLLWGNPLDSIPTQIWNLSNLTSLSLSQTGLSTVPPEISNLNKLEGLYLEGNNLSSLPSELWALKNLTQLDLDGNQLSSLPAELGNLNKLTKLELRFNQLSTLPSEIGNLTSLNILYLDSNELSTLPAEIGNIKSLTELLLGYNQLTSLPASFVNLTSMTTLNLEQNRIAVTDEALRTWMNAHDPDWADTQQGDTQKPTETKAPTSASTKTLPPTETKVPTPALTKTLPPTETKAPTPASNNTPQPTATHTPTTAVPINTPLSTLTAVPTATPILTPIQNSTAGPPDSHESDDLCSDASTILTDGTSQEHTFHAASDLDWVRFDAVAQTEYRIEITVPDDSEADIVPELYAQCETLPEDANWSGTFGPGARLTFTPVEDGPLFLRFANQDDNVYGADVAYQLSVRAMAAEPQSRALILVAGKYSNDDQLQSNIHNVTNRVYEVFQRNGYANEDIHYLATDDQLPGYDDEATLENIELAITQWAMGRLENDGVLNIYIMDHGNRDQLFIDYPNGHVLGPSDLDGWLTQLEDTKTELKINVFLEACHIGSFIQNTNSSTNDSISKSGRVIITSSNQDFVAYASQEGAYFSDRFLTGLQQGRDLATSFTEARDEVSSRFLLQRPWLDANGNGIHNESEDYTIAAQRSFAFRGSLTHDNWPPHIEALNGSINVEENSGTIQAEILDDDSVEEVWAVIYPPSYAPQDTRSNELVQENLLTLKLTKTTDNLYESPIITNEQGVHQIVIHAKDSNGLLASPKTLTFSVGYQVYLPMVSR